MSQTKMKRRGGDNRDYEELEGVVTSRILEPELDAPKADRIGYPQNINTATKELIDLLRGTVKALERSLLSGEPSSISSARASEPIRKLKELDRTKNDHRNLLLEETRISCSTECDDVEGSETTRRDISQSAGAFLTAIRLFVDSAEKRINISPMQQQEQERELRHAVRSNAQTEMNIRSLNEALSAQRKEHKKIIDRLNEELNTCKKISDEIEAEVEDKINRIVNKSEWKMVEIYKESLAKQNLLNSEIRILESRLGDLRESNIIAENELRSKRCQVETELINFLAKYDVDIRSRHMEMENLADEFQLLESERKTLENDIMIDLRKVYEDLQCEKAAASLKLLNERVEQFVRNRAARVIQKAWRAYWERHCAKKKKKSRRK